MLKKLLGSLTSIVIVFFVMLPFAASVSAECLTVSGNGDVDQTFGPILMTAGTTINITMTTDDGAGTAIFIINTDALTYLRFDIEYVATHTVSYTFEEDINAFFVLDWEYNGLPSNTFSISTSNCGGLMCGDIISDGRLNVDCGAPIAVYQNPLTVFGLDPASDTGIANVAVTDERIAEVGVPAVNTLLAEGVNSFTGQSIQVWRLSSGEFQINTAYADGKPYVMIWGGDSGLYYPSR